MISNKAAFRDLIVTLLSPAPAAAATVPAQALTEALVLHLCRSLKTYFRGATNRDQDRLCYPGTSAEL